MPPPEAGPGGGAPPPPSPEARALLAGLVPRLAELERHTAHWWLEHGVDDVQGGFHGTLDRRGQPCPPTNKGLVQQSRHLWAFSTLAERRSPTTRLRAVVDRTYELLVTRLRDPRDDEFYWQVTRSGQVVDPMKKLYGEGFAVYGLAACGRAFEVGQALDQALACFGSFDARTHDAAHGGYDQSREELSFIGGLPKGTNTHIHLMEALAELYAATGDALVAARLDELVSLVATRLLQPEGYVHPAFHADWTPAGPAVVSYGHDLETAWLLLEAARVLGRDEEPAVREAALRMGRHAADRGYDAESGGYFYSGTPNGAVGDRRKTWWVQFEALPGLWWLYRLTGDLVHLHRLEHTLGFIEAERDAEHGEWFFEHLPDGSLGPEGPNKGHLWKSSYHNLRALLFVSDWIREEL